MTPPVAPPDPKHPDMSPEAIDRRLRDLAQIYKLGMSLRDAKWLGPVVTGGTQPTENLSDGGSQPRECGSIMPGRACSEIASQ